MDSIKAFVPEDFSGKKISDYLIRGMGLTVTLVKKAKYGGVFLNGYSDHFPVQIFLIKEVK